jgi:hypothetical protein
VESRSYPLRSGPATLIPDGVRWQVIQADPAAQPTVPECGGEPEMGEVVMKHAAHIVTDQILGCRPFG